MVTPSKVQLHEIHQQSMSCSWSKRGGIELADSTKFFKRNIWKKRLRQEVPDCRVKLSWFHLLAKSAPVKTLVLIMVHSTYVSRPRSCLMHSQNTVP